MQPESIYNFVRHHMLTQGRQALSDKGTSVYRNNGGEACGVGSLMPLSWFPERMSIGPNLPDDLVNKTRPMVEEHWQNICGSNALSLHVAAVVLEELKAPINAKTMQMVCDFELIHERHQPATWAERFDEIGREYGFLEGEGVQFDRRFSTHSALIDGWVLDEEEGHINLNMSQPTNITFTADSTDETVQWDSASFEITSEPEVPVTEEEVNELLEKIWPRDNWQEAVEAVWDGKGEGAKKKPQGGPGVSKREEECTTQGKARASYGPDPGIIKIFPPNSPEEFARWFGCG